MLKACGADAIGFGLFLAFVQKMCWSVKVNVNDSSRNNNTNELFFRDSAHLSEAT